MALENYLSGREAQGKEGLFDGFLDSPILQSLLGLKSNKTTKQVKPESKSKSAGKEKDPKFSSIGSSATKNLRVNDTETDILGKMYNFLQEKSKFDKKKFKEEQKYLKESNPIKDQRLEDIIAAFEGREPRKIRKKTEEETKTKKSGIFGKVVKGSLAVGGLLLAESAFAKISDLDLGKIMPTFPTGESDEKPLSSTESTATARESAESYVGRKLSDKEWDLLLRATAAESSPDSREQTMVSASILNRVKKGTFGGKDVESVLASPYQFQAYSGTEGKGYHPSETFKAGPGKRQTSIEKSMMNLGRVSPEQLHFRSADPTAYGSLERGTKKIQEVKNQDYTRVGGSYFNTLMMPEPQQVFSPPKVTEDVVPNPKVEEKTSLNWSTLDKKVSEIGDMNEIIPTKQLNVLNNNTNIQTNNVTYALNAPVTKQTPVLIDKQYYTYG